MQSFPSAASWEWETNYSPSRGTGSRWMKATRFSGWMSTKRRSNGLPGLTKTTGPIWLTGHGDPRFTSITTRNLIGTSGCRIEASERQTPFGRLILDPVLPATIVKLQPAEQTVIKSAAEESVDFTPGQS